MKIPIKKNTIFISIASYRDEACNNTLKSIYSMAENPKNIYCGVVQQNDASVDSDCLYESRKHIINENITIMRLNHYEAKGPCWARYLASTLWSGQEYFLQIDSHSKFVKNWDTKCINMMKKLQKKAGPKIVISHYPKSDKYYGMDNPEGVTRICQSFFNNRDMISFLGAEELKSDGEFYETPYVAGGFILSTHNLLVDVPYDPNLDFLFVGEEIGHSIRIWTAGYNIYTPSENIIYHAYVRSGKPKVWNDNNYSDHDAFEKVKQMIGISSTHELPTHIKYNVNKYGLGNERTLKEYYEFAGIVLKDKRVYKNFCRKNNVGTVEDVKRSNEMDHPSVVPNKTLKVEQNTWWDVYYGYFYLFLAVLAFLFIIIYFIKIKTKHIKFFRRKR
jgi:hypothetical protein